jgi:glycosyltransferase involved in cell wall biosynthesis
MSISPVNVVSQEDVTRPSIETESVAETPMQKRAFHIMQVIGNLYVGGAQEVVRTLVEYFKLNGCQVVVCTFIDGPVRRDIEQLGVKVVVLPRRRSVIALPLFIVDMIRIWKVLSRLMKEHEIDVVQTHLFDFSTNALMLLLRFATPLRMLFWTVHSVNFGPTGVHQSKAKRLLFRSLYRVAARKANGFIAVSEKVKHAMLEAVASVDASVTVICNGVDVKRYGNRVDRAAIRRELGLPTDAYLAAVVGTLKEEKGHRYLIEAAAAIVPQCPNWHLLIIGDGILREQLQAQADQLRLGEHVHFLGNRHDVPDLLAASDLFVLPSLWEGLPMALIEAMASGLPVVASEVSGTVQVMLPGQTGLVVPTGSAQKLAEAIVQLVSDPGRARSMGIAARRQVVEGFSAQKQIEEHLALFSAAMGRASRLRQPRG